MKRKKSKMTQSREAPKKDGNNPLQFAIELQQQGKHLEAESLFRQILTVAPDNATVLYSLAVLELNSGRYEEALHHATVGVNATPDFAPLWSVQGAAFQALFT